VSRSSGDVLIRGFAVGRVLGFVLVLCLVGGAGYGAWTWLEKRQAEAALDALPVLTKDNATRAYLDGKGKVVQDMFDRTPELVADEGSCEDRVRSVLPDLGSPNELSSAATRVPDPTVRDLAVAHVSLLVDYAASCKGGGEKTEEAGERLTENKDSFDTIMAGDER
jgi:hypothetical protein